MEELYIKTEKGNIQIEQKQIEKYNLKAGGMSPNNGYLVVDKNGNENKESKKELKKDELSTYHSLDEILSDGIIFTASEKIDILQGVDS